MARTTHEPEPEGSPSGPAAAGVPGNGPRAVGPVRALADAYVAELCEKNPLMATAWGLRGYDHAMFGFGPDDHDAVGELHERTWTELGQLQPDGPDEQLCADVLADALTTARAAFASGDHLANLSSIVGDVAELRETLEQMAADPDRARDLAARTAAVPDALAGMRATWAQGRDRGIVASQRQVNGVVRQLDDWIARVGEDDDSDTTLRHALYDTREFLVREYLPYATTIDGCGPDAYARHAREHLGTELDVAEAYTRGFDELVRIETELRAEADRIDASASLAAVRDQLNADPRYVVYGEAAVRDWTDARMHDAIDALERGGQFTIPGMLRQLETRVSETSETVYYSPPSDDWSRPGRMWVPARSRTPVWGELSTCYHEGVPGHHLQFGTAVLAGDQLSAPQRVMFVPGHGEGWALYAERLMDELGFFAEPAYRFGYLYSQLFRAARVVIDIGVHCDLAIPDPWRQEYGPRWTPDIAYAFLHERTTNDDAYDRAEIERYLGWPAQAIAYKLGEHVWLDLRDDARRRAGGALDLARWHADALALGNVGLDRLTTTLGRRAAPSA